MAKNKKWEISGLSNEVLFCQSARIILNSRVDYLLSSIQKFFEFETADNLHSLRIALRRVRYNMELFYNCFDHIKFLNFYEKIKLLQDLTGNVRDLDVFKDNLTALKKENIRVTKLIVSGIEKKQADFKYKLKLELMKFVHSKALNNFKKTIS